MELKNKKGAFVHYGDSIQLFNRLTNCFLMLSSERHHFKNISQVKLSQDRNSETHFKIMPHESFNKEGTPIRTKEKLILACQSNKNCLIFIENKMEAYSFNRFKRIKAEDRLVVSEMQNTTTQINLEELPIIDDLPISEKNDLFIPQDCVCSNINSYINIQKESFTSISHVLTFVPIKMYPQETRKELRFGDYINIKKGDPNNENEGYFVSDVNYSGSRKIVVYQYYPKEVTTPSTPLSSIFQFVPRDMSDWGNPIVIERGSSRKILIRQFMTGRLMHILVSHNGIACFDEEPILVLGDKFSSFAKNWLNIQENISEIGDHKQEILYSPKKCTLDCIEDYFNIHSLTISKDITDEETALTVDNFISITKNDRFGLQINVNSNYEIEFGEKYCTYFQDCFHKLSVRYFSQCMVSIVEKQVSDNFRVVHSSYGLISSALKYSTMMLPIESMLYSKTKNIENIFLASKSLNELENCMVNSAAEKSGDMILYKEVQDQFKDIGLLDLCVNFYYHYAYFDKRKDREFEKMLNHISIFLRKACINNKLNCNYLFQWSKLYIELVLNQIWTNPNDPHRGLQNEDCRIDIDQLIGAILEKGDFSAYVAKDGVPSILRTLRFEKFEIKKIVLLIEMLRSREFRDTNILDLIKTHILYSENFEKLFKRFVLVDRKGKITEDIQESKYGGIGIKLDNEIKMIDLPDYLDKNKDSKFMRYLILTIKLAKELCKGHSSIFASRYYQFLSPKICTEIIISNKINPKLRSEVLQFFKESHLEGKCSTIQSIHIPELIWFNDKNQERHLCTTTEDRKNEILLSFKLQVAPSEAELQEETPFRGLIPLMLDYLSDPENYINIQDTYNLMSSILKMLMFLINKGLLVEEQIIALKLSLFYYLKNNLCLKNIHGQRDDSLDTGNDLNRYELRFFLKVANFLAFLEKHSINIKASLLMKEEESRNILFDNRQINIQEIEDKIDKKQITTEIMKRERVSREEAQLSNYFQEELRLQINELISKSFKSKIQARQNYFYTLGLDLAPNHTHYTYLLLEMVALGDLKLSEKSIEILMSLYEMRIRFMKTIPYIQVIYNDGLMNIFYERYLVAHSSISTCMTQLDRLSHQSSNDLDIVRNFDIINRNLTDLVKDFVFVIDEADSKKLLAKQFYAYFTLTVMNVHELSINNRPGSFLNIFNELYIDLYKHDLKQSMMKNIGLIDQIFDLLTILYNTQTGNTTFIATEKFFKEYMIFDQNERKVPETIIIREIGIKCVLILYFCCFNNTKNQNYINSKMMEGDFMSILFRLFIAPMRYVFAKHLMNFFLGIYANNLQLLLKVPQDGKSLIKSLMMTFFDKFDPFRVDRISFGLITTLRGFISCNKLKLYQNHIQILKFIRQQVKKKENLRIFFDEVLPNALTNFHEKDMVNKDEYPMGLELENSSETLLIRYPIEVAFAIQFLNLMSEICPKASNNYVIEIQLILPLTTLLTILSKCRNEWYILRREIFSFISTVYLTGEGQIEDDDWSEISGLVVNTIDEIEQLKAETIELSLSSVKHIYYDESPTFNTMYIYDNTNSQFRDFNCIDRVTAMETCITDGFVRFINRYIELMVITGENMERKFLAKLQAKLTGKRKHFLFKSLYNREGFNIKEQERSNEDSTEIVKGNLKKGAEMKEEIIKLLHERILTFNKKLNYEDNSFFEFKQVDDQDLGDIRYYSCAIEVRDRDNYDPLFDDPSLKDRTCYKEFNFYDDFMENEYYENILEEDMDVLADHLFGMSSSVYRVRFNKVIKVMLEILRYEFNDKKAKFNVVQILVLLINSGRKSELSIVMQLVEMGIVEIVCEVIIRYSRDFEYCSKFIELLKGVLQEEEEEIQIRLYNYLVQIDTENQFMISMKEYLINIFNKLETSENLRLDVLSFVKRGGDLDLVKAESIKNINQIEDCLEMLRLMCENHFLKLQNFMREQKIGVGTRSSTVNLLAVISGLLLRYNSFFDEFNVRLGIKIFEFYAEVLQGPCTENQREVCSSNLMETVEDLLMNLINFSSEDIKQNKGDILASDSASRYDSFSTMSLERSSGGHNKGKFHSERQYSVSKMIDALVVFMLAVLEATHDEFVISKMNIHTQIELFFSRLVNIYTLFEHDIETGNLAKLIQKAPLGRLTQSFSKSSNATKILTMSTSRSSISATLGISENGDENVKFKQLIKKDGVRNRIYNEIIAEGVRIVILLRTLGDLDRDFHDNLQSLITKKSDDSLKFTQIYTYFTDKVRCIEIVNSLGKLQTVYFQVPYISKSLSKYTKERFEDDVNRDNANEKVKDLLMAFPDFLAEMKHFHRLKSWNIPVDLTYFSYLKVMSLLLVLTINVIQLLSNPQDSSSFGSSSSDLIIRFLGFVIMGIYILIFGLWFLFNSVLDLRKVYEKLKHNYEKITRVKNHMKRSLLLLGYFISFFFKLLIESNLLDFSMNVIFAILGSFVSRIFFSFMLLDLIGRSDLLKNVIKAISLNIQQLMMTGILGIVVIFVFSTISEYSKLRTTMVFVEDFEFRMCDDYTLCFLSVLGFGLRSGGGIGDVLKYPDFQTERSLYIQRFFFDYLFFAIVILIYFNILSGSIIDTFGDLREQKTRYDYDRTFKCYICDIEKTEFAREGLDFADHREDVHNPWDYIDFITYVQEIEQSNQNGTESYVFDKLNEFNDIDISWIPLGRTKSLANRNIKKEELTLQTILKRSIENMKKIGKNTLGDDFEENEIFKIFEEAEMV